MIREDFLNGNSLLHNLDPRIKICVAVLFSIIIAITSNSNIMLAGAIFCLTLLLFSKLDLKKFFKRILIINGFIIFLWFFLPFSIPGRMVLKIGQLVATLEGIHYAFLITVKSNIIIIACITLLSTSSIFVLIHALSHLYCPEKLTQIFLFNFRYIHLLHMEYQKLRKTLKVRCFVPKTNIRTYKTYANLIAMLLLKSYDRADRVYKAMLCRGFKGKYHILDHFSLTWKDYVIGTIMIIFLIGMMICELTPKFL